jgi:hypothetical protein
MAKEPCGSGWGCPQPARLIADINIAVIHFAVICPRNRCFYSSRPESYWANWFNCCNISSAAFTTREFDS